VKPKPKKTDDLDDVLSGGAGKGGDEEAVSDIEKAAAKDVAAAAATKAKAAEVSAQKKSNETEDMLFCFDLANGREVWRFRKPGGPTGLGAPNTPCVADGKVIGNNRGKILVLNAKSGKTLISAATQVADCTSCALADGKLLANGGSHLRCYNLGRP
jgi:outer membrane protein assembly factor BamB